MRGKILSFLKSITKQLLSGFAVDQSSSQIMVLTDEHHLDLSNSSGNWGGES